MCLGLFKPSFKIIANGNNACQNNFVLHQTIPVGLLKQELALQNCLVKHICCVCPPWREKMYSQALGKKCIFPHYYNINPNMNYPHQHRKVDVYSVNKSFRFELRIQRSSNNYRTNRPICCSRVAWILMSWLSGRGLVALKKWPLDM